MAAPCGRNGVARCGDAGVRTLDTLHVAAALELGCRDFMNNDERQARLAAAMRLNVVRL